MIKIINLENLDAALKRVKTRGKLVLVGGCFDILHRGHIEFLRRAKKQGDILFVMLENDESVRARKGKNKPVNSQEDRAILLSAIPDVDIVLLLPYLKTDLEYYDLVKLIEPDIIAMTENDPAYNKKSEQAKIVGGKAVIVIKRLPEHSSKKLARKIK